MLPEYLRYWAFEKPPFSLAPDPEMLYFSNQHKEGLLRLKYAVYSNKGGTLLVSDHPGDGKTTLLLKLIADLKEESGDKTIVAFLDHPTLTASQMIAEITRQLTSGRASGDKIQNLNLLREHLKKIKKEGYKAIAIIDEGQMLAHRPDLLQELRILLNLCDKDSFLLTFIFSGQKPLETAVRGMPEFWQRLPVRFFLGNLNLTDTKGLIRYRIQKASTQEKEIFTDTAFEGIYRFSQGCPRVICTVADLALLIGHTTYAKKIDFVQVSQACADMNKTGNATHYYHYLQSMNQKKSITFLSGPEKRYRSEGKKTSYSIKRDFLLGINRMKTGNFLKKTNDLIRKYKLDGQEKPFFVLPKGGLLRDSILIDIDDNGQNFSSSKVGLALSESAIHFLLKSDIQKLPYNTIKLCRTRCHIEKGKPFYQIRIEGEVLSCWLAFPCFKEEAKTFVNLLEGFIKAKCSLL